MLKSTLCILTLLLLQHYTPAEDRDPLFDLPQMTPEKCALQSPDALLNKLMNEKPKPEGVGDCEGCVDEFYLVYATQLAKKTDADFPAAKKMRPKLLVCFDSTIEYLSEVHHHNGIKHYPSRVSGQVEWILFNGLQQHYRDTTGFDGSDIMANAWMMDDSQYTPQLIRQLAIAIGKANTGYNAHFEKEMLPILDRALHSLAEAEALMKDDTEKNYYRRYLALYITRFI